MIDRQIMTAGKLMILMWNFKAGQELVQRSVGFKQ